MPRPKNAFKPIYNKKEGTIEFMHAEGYVDLEEGKIDFTFNVFPAYLEEDQESESFNKEIDFLIKYRNFLDALRKSDPGKVYTESDFYESEGDLNIRVEVKTNHKLFVHLFKPE